MIASVIEIEHIDLSFSLLFICMAILVMVGVVLTVFSDRLGLGRGGNVIVAITTGYMVGVFLSVDVYEGSASFVDGAGKGYLDVPVRTKHYVKYNDRVLITPRTDGTYFITVLSEDP